MEYSELIKEFVSQLPDDKTSDFSTQITDFVVESISSNKGVELENIINEQLKGLNQDSDKRFAYFYILVVYYRRMKSNSKLGELITSFEKDYSKRPLFLFSKSSFELNKNTKQSCEMALMLAEECIEIIKNKGNDYDSEYLGFYNHYSTIIVRYLEKKYEIDRSKIELAKDYIWKCIKNKKDNPTYYVTLARLELNDYQYDSATTHVQYAIDIENDIGRISEYNDLLVKIEYQQTIQDLEEKSNQISQLVIQNQKLIEENKINILEYLGFFSGVMAFLITSANIAVSNPDLAYKLILMMLGALLIGFSSFTMLIQKDNYKIWRIVTTVCIGILLIILAYWMV